MKGIQKLSGNTLKIIGAAAMTLDHIGMILFPSVTVFRIIGRIALPIFAFFVSEGARYTKNRIKHTLLMLGVGLLCQVAVLIATGEILVNVLITLSMSTVVCYLIADLKKALFTDTSWQKRAILTLCLAITVIGIYALNEIEHIEYGFIGCMLPPLASLNHMPSEAENGLRRFDRPWISVLLMSIGVLLFAIDTKIPIQFFALLSIPILLTYSGKRGGARLKYFFYIFYPAHLVIILAVYMLVNI